MALVEGFEAAAAAVGGGIHTDAVAVGAGFAGAGSSCFLQPDSAATTAPAATSGSNHLFGTRFLLIILNLFLIKEAECGGKTGNFCHHPVVDILDIGK